MFMADQATRNPAARFPAGRRSAVLANPYTTERWRRLRRKRPDQVQRPRTKMQTGIRSQRSVVSDFASRTAAPRAQPVESARRVKRDAETSPTRAHWTGPA